MPSTVDIAYQWKELGYDTFNPFINIGSLSLLYFLYLLEVMIILVLKNKDITQIANWHKMAMKKALFS